MGTSWPQPGQRCSPEFRSLSSVDPSGPAFSWAIGFTSRKRALKWVRRDTFQQLPGQAYICVHSQKATCLAPTGTRRSQSLRGRRKVCASCSGSGAAARFARIHDVARALLIAASSRSSARETETDPRSAGIRRHFRARLRRDHGRQLRLTMGRVLAQFGMHAGGKGMLRSLRKPNRRRHGWRQQRPGGRALPQRVSETRTVSTVPDSEEPESRCNVCPGDMRDSRHTPRFRERLHDRRRLSIARHGLL